MPATAPTPEVTDNPKVVSLPGATPRPYSRGAVRNRVEDAEGTAALGAPRKGNRLMDRPEYATKPAPLVRSPETSVAEAVAAMTRNNYGSVVVVDPEERVIGVVTERDIMTKLVAHGLDAKTTPLAAIMTENPRLARRTDDMLDWLRIMSNERFRRLPVVDEEGRIEAVFTQGDFVSYTWPDLMYQMKSMVKATVSKNHEALVIFGGVGLYTLILIGVMAVIL